MPKKITIDKDGFVVSTGDDSPASDEIRRCKICREPLDPDKPHECNALVLGKTVYNQPTKEDNTPSIPTTEQATFSIVCPLCQEAHDLQSLPEHLALHRKKFYWIMYRVRMQCPFCRGNFSVSEMLYHLGVCKHKPSKGHVTLSFKTTFNNKVNIIRHSVLHTTSDQPK